MYGRGSKFNINLAKVYDQEGGVISGNDLVGGERKQVLNLPGKPMIEHLFDPYPDNFREECPFPPSGNQDG